MGIKFGGNPISKNTGVVSLLRAIGDLGKKVAYIF